MKYDIGRNRSLYSSDKSRETVEMPEKQVVDSHQKHNQKSHGARKSSGGKKPTKIPKGKRAMTQEERIQKNKRASIRARKSNKGK